MDMLDPMMPPDLGGDVLGLGPDPRLTPPPKPDLTRKPDKTRDLVRLALTGLALGLGPGRGTGLAAGLSMADQQYRQDQRLREQDALRQYQTQYTDWQQQARAYQQEADRRGQMLVKTLDNLAADIEGTRSSNDAERVYQMYGQALTAYGFRGYDAESLKRKIKSPDRKARAMKAVDAFLKNPAFKSAYEQDPESVSQATVEVDGVPVTLAEAMEIAGSGMINRETGKAITPRTTPKADTRSLQVQAADALARGDNAAYNRLLQTEREFAAAGRAPAGGGSVPNVGSFEDYVRRAYGTNPTPDQILEARKNYNAKGGTPGVDDLSPAQLSAANALSDDFVRDSKDFITRAQSLNTILSSAKQPSAAGDLALIFSYMKMLDPGSTVREGEFANAQNAAGVPEQIRALYNRMRTGERLSADQRKDFVNRARGIYTGAKRLHDQTVKTYTQRAELAKVPVAMVIQDYAAGVDPADDMNQVGASALDKLNQRGAARGGRRRDGARTDTAE